MKTIPLTQGRFALVDDSDYKYLSRHKWTAFKNRTVWYAYRKSNGKQVYMHREILGLGAGEECDHRDRNGLNNLRSNLRVANRSQNNSNSGLPRHNTSGVKGVRFTKGKWEANISKNNRQVYIGRFDSRREAAAHYDFSAKMLRGEFAVTNESLGIKA